MNYRVALFGFAAAFGAAALLSAPSVLYASGAGTGKRLREGRGKTGNRTDRQVLDGLVIAEVALAVILLTGAGLMLKSLGNLNNRDLGITTEGLMTFGIAPSVSGLEAVPERQALLDRLLERLKGIPGVEAAAFTNFNPLRDHGWGATLWPEGRPATSMTDVITVNHRGVSEEYFQVAGTALLGGRGFTKADASDAPEVAIVSRSLAERLWPGETAVGRRVRTSGSSDEEQLVTVVGIAEDVADFGVLTDTWYRPYRQDPTEFTTRTLEIFVRLAPEAVGVVEAVRGTIRELAPFLPVFNIQSAQEIIRFERRGETFTTFILGLFSGIGLLLAAVGIFGVLTHAVARRGRELSLRMALGAQRMEIMALVLRSALTVVGSGLLLGLAGAAALTRTIEGFLVGVSPLDPSVFAIMSLGALLVAVGAASLPAWQAAKVDPGAALQEE
jgi:putative ABC transport system permease protein